METAALWPVRPAPFEDESMTSWLARLAHGHGLQLTRFLEIVSPSPHDPLELDWSTDPDLRASLSARTAVPRARVDALLLGFDPEAGLEDLLHRNWQGPALQYCPACLDEEIPYYRRTWRLACVRVCSRHGLPLRDACGECGGSIRLDDLLPGSRSLRLCPHCGFDLTSAGREVTPATQSLRMLLRTQERISRILLE